jgi:uncharacterized protein YceK
MRKFYLSLLVLTTLLLAGCLPQVQATSTSTPNSRPVLTATSTVQSQPAPTAVQAVPTQAALFPVSGCTVITRKPTPGPTAESVFPLVNDTDWVKGPATARVTIIEYSDFQ